MYDIKIRRSVSNTSFVTPIQPSTTDKTGENNEPNRTEDEVPVDTESEYNFYDARKLLHDSESAPSNSTGDAVIHMLNLFFGGGVLGMHVAFHAVGITSAGVGMIILAAMIAGSMCSLTNSAHKTYYKLRVPKLTYPELIEKVTSSMNSKIARFIRCFVELTIMLKDYGSCLVYQVFIARTIKHISVITDETPRENMTFYILAVNVICVFLIMIRNMKVLTPFTVPINLYISVLALIIIYYGSSGTVAFELIPSLPSYEGLFKFIGMAIFCLDGVSVSLPIENIMLYPKKFTLVVIGSTTYATFIMILIGVFGYHAFGDKATAPITILLPWNHFTLMIKVFSCITMSLSYTKLFYFGFDIQWQRIKNWHHISKWYIWERFYRIINVTILALLACCIYDVSALMGFLGCVFGSLVCFIYPIWIQYGVSTSRGGGACWMLLLVTLVSSFGIVLILAGFYFLFDNIVGENVYKFLFKKPPS